MSATGTRAAGLFGGALLVLLATRCADAPEERPAASPEETPTGVQPSSGLRGPVRWLTPEDGVQLEPAAAFDAQGRLWVGVLDLGTHSEGRPARLLLHCSEGERVRTVDLEAGAWPAGLQLVGDGEGVLALWEEGQEDARVLRARHARQAASGLELGPREGVPSSVKPLAPALARSGPDEHTVVFQGLNEGQYDLYASRRQGTAWTPATPLWASPEDEWNPRLVSQGKAVHLVHDRFDGESFDVGYARLVEGRVRERHPIAAGPDYEGFPELALDGAGRVWIAWERAPQFGEAGGLRAERALGLAVLEPGAEQRLSYVDTEGFLAPDERADFPRLVAGRQGLFLTWRSQAESYHPPGAEEYASFYTSWFARTLAFDAEGAPQAGLMRAADGDNEASEVPLLAPSGEVWMVFATDGRRRVRPIPFAFEGPIESNWRVGVARLGELNGFPPVTPDPPPALRIEAPRPAAAPLVAADGTRAYVGDLHRHTHVSRCQGARDGLPIDVYRYAKGPGALDFVAVTDHHQHLTRWQWWRNERDVARYHAPGSLVTFLGVERAIREKGHYNDVYLVPRAPYDHEVWRRPAREVGPAGAEGTLSIPHMMGRSQAPWSWSDFNPELHRLFEVYQGLRGSYEGPGAPYEAYDRVLDGSSLAAGLEAGHHFGLLAASDHSASSTALVGCLAEELSREAIFAALRARRTFAATGHVWARARLGAASMGETVTLEDAGGARFEVSIESPRRVARVEVLKNGRAFAQRPGAGPVAGAESEIAVLSCRRSRALTGEDPWTLELEGARFVEVRPRNPGGGVRLSVGERRLQMEKAPPWVDLALEVRADGDWEDVRLILEYGGKRAERSWTSVAAGAIERQLAPLDRESLWRLGAPLDRVGPFTLAFEDPDALPGDSYYARIAFDDGQLVWTSPIRVVSR